jgi:2-phospho-L-lactate guanylyltransferase
MTSMTTAILPIKRVDSAKQRLGEVLDAASRAKLVETMFLDVLAKLRRCKHVQEVLVVTADDRIKRTARWLGADVLDQDGDAGHSRAAAAGVRAAVARGADRVALLPGDCPLLDPGELDAELGPVPRSLLIVPDHHETGTNALIISPPQAIEPAFGPDSCARHVQLARRARVGFCVVRIPSLALDLDTPEDLVAMRDALLLDPERAPRTSDLIWELGVGEEQAEPLTA